jgi:hypothetical protein
VAQKGGFVSGTTESGSPILKNPASQPLLELLDNVLALSRFNFFCMTLLDLVFQHRSHGIDESRIVLLI